VMNAVEPEPEPIRTGHAAFGNGQLVVTYLVDGHIEIPVYAADAPLVAGECQPAITLEISPAEAHLLAAQISDAAYRVNAAAGEDDSVAGGLLDMALAAAARDWRRVQWHFARSVAGADGRVGQVRDRVEATFRHRAC
jgi:hypothetical protein